VNERELDREIRFHFDQLVADYVRQGMTEAQARRKARQEFGGMDQVKEDCRDARRTLWLDSTLQDIRFSLRSMRKNAALTLTVIATLALLGTFAGIALLLASVGIYGVISYSVSQRTREIGIRMALGARPGDILKSVVGQGAVLSMAGIAVGIIASFFLTRFMSSLLFGVGRTDPLTFCAVAIALSLVALAASFLPALRGAKADPLSALRCE
jgi:ABC-type antimicrobial peptide transport system permease subunit